MGSSFRALTIRLTKHQGITDARVKKYAKQYERVIVAFEGADGEVNSNHYHILISSAKERGTIERDFKVAFPEAKGNSWFSISPSKRNTKNEKGKQWVEDKTEILKLEKYHCKGKEKGNIHNIILYKEYTLDDIKAFNQLYWETNALIVAKKKPKKNVSKAKLCLEYLTERSFSFLSNGILNKRRLSLEIANFFRKSIVVHDKYILARFYNLAHLHFSPKGYSYRMLNTFTEDDLGNENVYTGRGVSEDDNENIDDMIDEIMECDKALAENKKTLTVADIVCRKETTYEEMWGQNGMINKIFDNSIDG